VLLNLKELRANPQQIKGANTKKTVPKNTAIGMTAIIKKN